MPPAACLRHHTVLAKTILRYVRPDRFWMTVGHGSTLRGGPQYSCTGVGLWAVGKPQQWAQGLGFCALLGKGSTSVLWIGWDTAFQLYPGPLSAGGDVHVHGLRASVPLKTSKRVCSSPPAWWLFAILVQCISIPLVWGTFASYWVVNHLVGVPSLLSTSVGWHPVRE